MAESHDRPPTYAPAVENDKDAINRSLAIDLIIRCLAFRDWTGASPEEVESVAERLLSQVEERLRGGGR